MNKKNRWCLALMKIWIFVAIVYDAICFCLAFTESWIFSPAYPDGISVVFALFLAAFGTLSAVEFLLFYILPLTLTAEKTQQSKRKSRLHNLFHKLAGSILSFFHKPRPAT